MHRGTSSAGISGHSFRIGAATSSGTGCRGLYQEPGLEKQCLPDVYQEGQSEPRQSGWETGRGNSNVGLEGYSLINL